MNKQPIEPNEEEDEDTGDVIYEMLGDFMAEVFLTPMWGERVTGYRDWRTGKRRDEQEVVELP